MDLATAVYLRHVDVVFVGRAILCQELQLGEIFSENFYLFLVRRFCIEHACIYLFN